MRKRKWKSEKQILNIFKFKNAKELLEEKEREKKVMDEKYEELQAKYQEVIEIKEESFIETSERKRKFSHER